MPHLREYNNRIIPAKVVGDPYPGYHPQEDKYGRRTEDCPIDADQDRSKVRVPRRRYGFRLIGHDNWQGNPETSGRVISR